MRKLVFYVFAILISSPVFASDPPYRGQCSKNPIHKVLPDIRDVLSLCNDGQYKEAERMLADLWNDWVIKDELTDDQHIALHFFSAYLEEKMGNSGPAEAHISRVALFQISHHFPISDKQ